MTLLEILIIAVGVSMDAFAVSICKGLSVNRLRPRNILSVALWFGGFQALMPLIGYFLGVSFADFVSSVDHWISFVLLGIIGGNMVREAAGGDDDEHSDADFSFRTMLPLAIATSIDALAVGISFSCIGYSSLVQLAYPLVAIGVVSSLMTAVGLWIGVRFGKAFAERLRAELWGGIVLIIIGLKVLYEHLL